MARAHPMSHPGVAQFGHVPGRLSSFHPAVAGSFKSRFPAPTEAQARAWAVTSSTATP